MMRGKGLPRNFVLEQLNLRLAGDLTYDSGRIVSSMCTTPHPLARQVYQKYLDRNIGDPGLFPSTAKLEEEAIQILGEMLSNPNTFGHLVSGGTEANLTALWAARNLFGKRRNEVIVPVSAHYSFDKAADILGLKLVKAKLNEQFQVDMDSVEDAITSKTLAIVGIAGTTSLGVVDPIQELSDMASKHELCLHVDAAFGGFVLPFLRELGYTDAEFDFKISGVQSITVDPHKMGLAPIPAGGILFREKKLAESISIEVPYLTGEATEQSTFAGTRSGAAVLAVWALLTHLGREGYKDVVKRCMELTWNLADEVEETDKISLMMKPMMNIVGIKSENIPIRRIAEKLREKGWAISLFPTHIRVVIMPHTKPEHIQCFVKDLRRAMKEIG